MVRRWRARATRGRACPARTSARFRRRSSTCTKLMRVDVRVAELDGPAQRRLVREQRRPIDDRAHRAHGAAVVERDAAEHRAGELLVLAPATRTRRRWPCRRWPAPRPRRPASSRRTASARACAARRPPRARAAGRAARCPAPNQPGTIWRDWFQAKTQGMARRSSMVARPLRRAGRDPSGSAPISSSGVDCWKYSTKRGPRTRARYASTLASAVAREGGLVLRHLGVGRLLGAERRAEDAAGRQLEVALGDGRQKILPARGPPPARSA